MNARTPNGIPAWGMDRPEQSDHGELERYDGNGSAAKADALELTIKVDTSGIDAATKALERFVVKMEEAKRLAAEVGLELDFDEGALGLSVLGEETR